jgi:hypothetical protein
MHHKEMLKVQGNGYVNRPESITTQYMHESKFTLYFINMYKYYVLIHYKNKV